MSTNKKLKDYIPGQDDFLSFANTMNNNAAIDMARNNITSPNSPTTPSTGLQSGGVTLTGGNAPAAAPLKIDNALGGAPVLGDVAPVNNGGTETGTGTGTEIGTETVTDAGTGITAPSQTYVPSISDDEKDYDTWYGEQGVDLDRQYGDAKAALEYEYMTSMSNYGQTAEKLYQMGLSGSGLSDIFQANAFSAYLNQQNALANQLIEQKKQMRLDYNNYLSERNAGIKTDTANAYNLGLTQYDGANADYVRRLLAGQGYHSQVIDNVMNALTAIDPDTLPIVKQRAADAAAKAEEANAKAELEKKLTTLAFNSYNGDNIGEVETLLLSEANADTEMVNRIITGLRAMTPEQLADSTAYKAKLAQEAADAEQKDAEFKTNVSAAVEYVLGNNLYKPGDEASITNIQGRLGMLGYDTEVIEAVIDRLSGLTSESLGTFGEFNVDSVATNLMTITDDKGNVTFEYDGSNSAKLQIKQMLESEGYGDKYEEVIAKMDVMLGENKKAKLDDFVSNIEKIDISDVSLESMNLLESTAVDSYGRGSEEYKTITAKIKEKIDKAYEDAFKDVNGSLEDAYGLAGKTEEEWTAMDDGERISALLESTKDYFENGYLSNEEKNRYFNEWIEVEIEQASAEKTYHEQQNYLLDLLTQIEGFIASGHIESDDYSETIRMIKNKAFEKEYAADKKYKESGWADFINLIGEALRKTAMGS